MSNCGSQDGKNYEHNVFRDISIRPNQEELVCQFIDMLDVSQHTIDAFVLDIRKFAKCQEALKTGQLGAHQKRPL